MDKSAVGPAGPSGGGGGSGSKSEPAPTATSAPAPAPEDAKNRGWPKGKKRYPKTPGAPKQPLSGYVHFLNEQRVLLRKACPDLSFADVSKRLANQWSALPKEEKSKYTDRADQDKERYSREFMEYQQTDDYKKYVEEANSKGKDKAMASSSSGAASGTAAPPKKKAKKSVKVEAAVKAAAATPPIAAPPPSSASPVREDSLDVPIFTEAFLEYNKSRESELRQLRKQVTEMDEQNAILQKHVDNMRSAIGKLEAETRQQQDNNSQLQLHVDGLRRWAVGQLQAAGPLALPTRPGEQPSPEPVTLANVDQLMKTLHGVLVTKTVQVTPSEEALVAKVRAVVEKIDFKTMST